MKKNIKNIGLVLLSLSLLISCKDNDKTNSFNPTKSEKVSPESDAEHQKKLSDKKAQFDAQQGGITEDQLLVFDGKVKLTTMIPSDQGLSDIEMKLLEGKLIQMVTANGIGGLGANPRFIIAPVVTILRKDVTSTAPVKYSIKYNVNFYVADILTGSVYGSYSMSFTSIEASEARAFITGFENLKSNDIGFQEFLKKSQEKIITYYNDNGDKIITEATTLASQKKYAQALTLLESIPMEADVPYKNAAKISGTLFQKYLDNECETVLAMMKSAFGTYNKLSAAGYNEEAMGYYKLIPSQGKCKKEADAIYASYKKGLNPQKIKDWEKADKEWQFKVNQQNSDNSFRQLQEEMKAKIAIEGNACLLDKYKKDAAYDNLPWLRKLIHIGDYDPFDGYKPNNDCN